MKISSGWMVIHWMLLLGIGKFCDDAEAILCFLAQNSHYFGSNYINSLTYLSCVKIAGCFTLKLLLITRKF